MMVAASLIRLPGSHFVLGSLYSQAAVHLAVSVASQFRTGTDSHDDQGIYPLIVVILVNREASMDKTLFNSTLPVIITDLQQASSHFRASQIAARQPKSMPVADLQFTAAQEPGPMRDSLDPSSLRDSLASSSSLTPEVDPEIRLENSYSVD